jgi:hypothetical protein
MARMSGGELPLNSVVWLDLDSMAAWPSSLPPFVIPPGTLRPKPMWRDKKE